MTESEELALLKNSCLHNMGSREDIRNLINHLMDVARRCDSPLHEQAALAIQSLSQRVNRYMD